MRGQSFFYVLSLLLLAACAPSPRQLGLSNQQWQAMTVEQQQQLQADYAKTQRWFADNDTRLQAYQAAPIDVTLQRGEAMMPPFQHPIAIAPISARFYSGQCKNLRLHSPESGSQVKLKACYNGLRLALDPSSWQFSQRQGTLFFYQNPLWESGFTYVDVNSRGYVRLQEADIQIKTVKLSS